MTTLAAKGLSAAPAPAPKSRIRLLAAASRLSPGMWSLTWATQRE